MKNIVRLLASATLAVGLVAGPAVAPALASGHAAKAAKASKASKAAKAARSRAAKRLAVNAFIVRQTAKALNISVKQLAQEVKGTTLSAVIVAHGQTVADVEAKVVAAFKAKLDARVAAKKLTQDRADALLARFQKHVDRLLNRQVNHTPGAKAARIALGLVLHKAAADYLGLTPAQLRQQLKGHSLADLAQAQAGAGKSVQGLEDAMVAAVKAKLDKAVANHRLAQDRADTILAKVQGRIGDIVNKVHPA